MIKYGTARWTVWTPAAWGKALPADRYVVVMSDGKQTTPPLRVSLNTLRSLAQSTIPLSVEIRSASGENIRDLLAQRLEVLAQIAANNRDARAAPSPLVDA